jgi:EAL domain-containing protein (putative c-di-GMP-specific phosphodiesterase class I)
MLRNTETTIEKLNHLRSLGVRLAIDDFGTGYSSLSYLHKFPIDVLKIDRSFIEKINEGLEGAAMAKAIISMSETLHLDTIAEGIETTDQITTLKDLGCEMGQGYLFARPLGIAEMESFLKDMPPDRSGAMMTVSTTQPGGVAV